MKMKNTLRNLPALVILAVSTVILSSCSPMTRLFRENDPDQMYRAALQLYYQKKSSKAIMLFQEIEPNFKGSARADTILFYSAVSLFRLQEYLPANEALQEFRRLHNRSPFIEEAEYLIGLSYYRLSPEPELDQVPTQMAIMQFNEYLRRYPNSVKRGEVNDMIAQLMQKLYDKSFLNARLYYDIENYKSAIQTFRLALTEYPESTRREEILYLLTRSCFIYAENSIESLQHDRYLTAIDAYFDLIQDFPETKYRKEVDDMYEKSRVRTTIPTTSEPQNRETGSAARE
jgi:outer membrane protein assembly factor BamD